jgi:hypothetical protein
MTHKVSTSNNNYSIRQSKGQGFKVSVILGGSNVANLSDLSDVDVTGIQDGNILTYNSSTGQFTAINPDSILSNAVTGGLPNEFVDKLGTDLDDKVDLDAGGF